MKPFSIRPLLLCAGLLAAAFAQPRTAAAQVPDPVAASDTIYEVRIADGSVLYGRVRDEGATLTVLTRAGATVRVERAQVSSIRPMQRPPLNEHGWREDPNTTRLFFGPTARAVGAGSAYIGVYEVLLPFVTVGVSDNVTLSGGTPIIPEIIGEIFYFAPKVTLMETEDMALATGAFVVGFDDETAGIVYGAGTLGTPDRAFTGGVGWGFSGGDLHNQPIVMLGGELRTGPAIKLITENHFLPGAENASGITSGGVRFFGDRLSADFGIAIMLGEADWFPLVNFVYRF
ncbi:MAG TPA: hypothetical protein VM759_10415 [Longimicrobium sp.]|nr:hypothetical protein [Longimicrobium sp.]